MLPMSLESPFRDESSTLLPSLRFRRGLCLGPLLLRGLLLSMQLCTLGLKLCAAGLGLGPALLNPPVAVLQLVAHLARVGSGLRAVSVLPETSPEAPPCCDLVLPGRVQLLLSHEALHLVNSL